MTKFTILTGSAIGKAINAFGKTIATFKEREHQLAFSALNHVDLHNDPKYLNALYAATPANYRGGLSSWALAFGRVTFDAKEGVFAYAKGKKSDLEAAMDVAPADYAKSQKEGAGEKAFDEIAELEKIIKRFAEKGASGRTLNALKGVLNVAKVGIVAETPKPAAIVKKAKAAPKAAPAEMQQAA
jgi:hypothetical protein